MKVSVNIKCTCGSGFKYKKCCMKKSYYNYSKLAEEMRTYAITATEMYNICIKEINNQVVDPIFWIYNQEKMRLSWEQYIDSLENVSGFMKETMLNNNFAKYMQYMYDKYPPGYGNAIHKAYKAGIKLDAVDTYFNLRKEAES